MNEREPMPRLSQRSALDWPTHAGVSDVVMREVERQVRRRRQRIRTRFAAAALAVVCALGVTWRMVAPAGSNAPATATASAMVSFPAREVLPDGTIVELNGGAKIRVDFRAGTPGPRRVELVRGEAHFQVTKDPDRPFVVVAGRVEVRAVGTAFAVQLAAAGVEVLVTEGRVAVEQVAPIPPARAAPAAAGTALAPPLMAMLEAGHGAVVKPAVPGAAAGAPQVVTVPADEWAERLAWRAPRLEFTDTKLREVLRMFNGHSQVRLALGDDGLGELRLSGIVRADNTSALLQLLSVEYAIDARTGDGGELVLVPVR